MDNLLDKYQIPKLNQDQIDHLNSLINPKEIEAVIEVSQPIKAQEQMVLLQPSVRTSKKT